LRRTGLIALVVGSLLALGAAPATAQSEDEGRALYEQNCQSCHQPGGIGVEGVFPALAGNPNVDDAEYVADVIRNGKSGELGVMPAFPQLSDSELASLVAYLQGLGGPPPDGTTTTAPAGPLVGDAVEGERVFVGATRLSAAGPACASCHAAGPYSQGGAGLGADLTDVYSRLGGSAGLSAWLANPPSPTMQPVYGPRPLTEEEITHLVAFFAAVDGSEPAGEPVLFVILAVGGLAGLLALMTFALRGPRRPYVERLRSTP
jgi:ubiquinol-cytochrome c reductase cytochrome c subunit